jgi:ubiquinone/menaquinone biosynthesis C-methylase UbiE
MNVVMMDAENYKQTRINHWDGVARKLDNWTGAGSYYHKCMAEVFRHLIPPGRRVIEIGCGRGDLLAALNPGYGLGIDFSAEMIRRAEERHPDLRFIIADAHDLDIRETFDYIILSDLVNDLWDVQLVFEQMRKLATPQTRVIINTYSRLWELPLSAARRSGLATPSLTENWLTVEDIEGLLNLAEFEPIRHWEEIVWPVRTPFLDRFMNRILARLWPFNIAALTHVIVARPQADQDDHVMQPRVSVIVPVRNEAGNIPDIFRRVPKMGGETELVFVEGSSADDTYEAVERNMKAFSQRPCKLLRQKGIGKGDAVREGFGNASGDILMILDGDLTVPPEDLPRFFEALISGKGEFINGVRLVYPMEKEAMRFLNLVGNKFFSMAFTWLLGQPIKDTLCGTKVLWKRDYERIAGNRAFFGDFDPFGDFDLLFGAAKLNLKIVEMPIRYRERTYGSTNISRWRHGWLLLKMVLFATRRIKFI